MGGYGGGLSQFDLSHNNLNGTIPTTIGELINLQTFDVSHNPELGADGCCDGADDFYKAFYGYPWSIPTEMGVLRKLQVLKMDHRGSSASCRPRLARCALSNSSVPLVRPQKPMPIAAAAAGRLPTWGTKSRGRSRQRLDGSPSCTSSSWATTQSQEPSLARR